MARETSAGVLAYRWRQGAPEFLLVHPGGPYWAAREEAGWSIPKGLVAPGEETWSAAAREFEEELGQPITGDPHPLSPCRTPGGKLILSWLVEADLDLSASRSNLFEMEWPPRSGNLRRYPEVDRAEYFIFETALWKAHRGQRPILLEAVTRLTAA